MTDAFFGSNHLKEDPFRKCLAMAGAAHLGAVAIFALGNVLFGAQWFIGENEKVETVQSAVRVDVVAMPKLTAQELKFMEPKQADSQDEKTALPKAAEPAPSESDIEFKKKADEKKVELSSLLGSLSSRDVEKAKKTKKKGMALSQKELDALVVEGNKVSKGQALTGDSLQAEQSAFLHYIAALPARVRPFWKLPSYLLDQDLRARIRVYISGSGEILKTEVYESSGVEEFDRRALSALEQAGTLPAPDRSISGRLSSGDVILGFPL